MSALGLGARAALGLGTDPRSALRRELKLRYKANEAVLTGSGTQALELAIHAVASPTRTTGPVALPAYGCFDIATAAVGARRPLALYDLDPDTLGPDPDSLRRAFACGATSAVVVSLYGLPPEWDAVSRCAADAGATLIEDAAQGAGGSWHGSPLGALAEVSVLSFGRGKGWTGGAGGALLLRGKCAVPE
ncbi:MAG: DegT/DnrJ/EryC1/StrS family aminotransferase, partial [Gemmatimonadales bacterium]